MRRKRVDKHKLGKEDVAEEEITDFADLADFDNFDEWYDSEDRFENRTNRTHSSRVDSDDNQYEDHANHEYSNREFGDDNQYESRANHEYSNREFGDDNPYESHANHEYSNRELGDDNQYEGGEQFSNGIYAGFEGKSTNRFKILFIQIGKVAIINYVLLFISFLLTNILIDRLPMHFSESKIFLSVRFLVFAIALLPCIIPVFIQFKSLLKKASQKAMNIAITTSFIGLLMISVAAIVTLYIANFVIRLLLIAVELDLFIVLILLFLMAASTKIYSKIREKFGR
ncbi:MAG: hypothetical protein LBN22_03165 [Clostridiales Family XIII bacterium]|jgi:hypothetical protein|nr:hypothetical protein [Clostridiales Family XIII bacterium]